MNKKKKKKKKKKKNQKENNYFLNISHTLHRRNDFHS